jgi:hypothetical protein
VDQWSVEDEDGNIIDTEKDRIRWDDDLTFTATRWELLEASLVAVPADSGSIVRSLSHSDPSLVVRNISRRMAMRHRMMGRLDDQ